MATEHCDGCGTSRSYKQDAEVSGARLMRFLTSKYLLADSDWQFNYELAPRRSKVSPILWLRRQRRNRRDHNYIQSLSDEGKRKSSSVCERASKGQFHGLVLLERESSSLVPVVCVLCAANVRTARSFIYRHGVRGSPWNLASVTSVAECMQHLPRS